MHTRHGRLSEIMPELLRDLDAWMVEPAPQETEEELDRPVYDARGKLLAHHLRDWNGAIPRKDTGRT